MKNLVLVLGILGFAFSGYGQSGGDDCGSATLITTMSFTAEVTASNTASNSMPVSTCYSQTFPDVWYTAEIDASGNFSMSFDFNSITGGIDPRVQFLQGTDCNSLAEIGCHTYIIPFPTFSVSGLSPGSIIYIRFVDNSGDENGTVDFTLSGTVLPVEWSAPTKAYIDYMNSDAIILFSTGQQINNSHFEIEYSRDGRKYQPIGNIEGEGNSNKEIDYEFIHDTPSFGINYYRVKQIDLNGQFSFSNVASVMYRTDEVNVYPNPVGDLLTVSLPNESSVSIYNHLGQQIGKYEFAEGENTVDLSSMDSGLYSLKFDDGTMKRVVKR